jgi:hypothetical protein
MSALRRKYLAMRSQNPPSEASRATTTPDLQNGLLCATCKTLFAGAVGSHAQTFPHHESVDSLYQGRDLGCRVCILIWERTTEEQREHLHERRGEKFELSNSHHYYGHMTRDDAYGHYRVIIEVFPFPFANTIRIDLALEPAKSKELLLPPPSRETHVFR